MIKLEKSFNTNLARAYGALALLLASSSTSLAAFSDRTVSAGTSWDLDQTNSGNLLVAPAANELGAIVGIGIAGSNDHVYTWYADGTVSEGYSRDLEHHGSRVPFKMPKDANGNNLKEPSNIVAMAIAGSNDRVYTWYDDNSVSVGWSQDLGYYSGPSPVTFPEGLTAHDLVGVGIAGSNDHVYAWFANGTVSEGKSRNLAGYAQPYAYTPASGTKIGHIIGMGIAGSTDRVYTWYQDVELGNAHGGVADRVDAMAMDLLRRYRLPGLGISVSKNGRMVLEKGYGYRNVDTGSRMLSSSRCRIGSVSKMVTALSAMHLHQEDEDFSVDQPVYGGNGALNDSIYSLSYGKGIDRFQPIVSQAIASDDRVYTWYGNGTVSRGWSRDLDHYAAPKPYSVAPGKSAADLRAVAISGQDRVWAFYDDGTFSAGSSTTLDSRVARDPGAKVVFPSGYSMKNVVGLDMNDENHVYVWYDNGMTSAGTVEDFAAHVQPRSYIPAAGKSRYDIRGIGIAKSNSQVYVWYSDNTLSRGWSRDLDSHEGPRSYSLPNGVNDAQQDWDHWYGELSISHLMSHSAGFSRSGDIEGTAAMFNVDPEDVTYTQIHRHFLRTRKLGYEPGTWSQYSNHGMGLVGHIVAEQSGQTFRQYAQSHVVDAIGLNMEPASEGQDPNDAYAHRLVDGVPSAYLEDPASDVSLAAGGWKSSAGDLVRLMLATDRNPNHPDLLSPTTLDKMETRPYPGASSYALGWKHDKPHRFHHNGKLGAGTTYVARYDAGWSDLYSDQITVAVCTNISISKKQGSSKPLRRLAERIAKVTGTAEVSTSYDLH